MYVAMATVLLSAGCSQAAPNLPAGSPKIETTPGQSAREIVRTAWPVDANVVWVWTAVDALNGAEHLVLTRDAGRNWANVTPVGLTNETPARRITAMFALDAEHVWITYGGITDDAPQTVASTADGGRHWAPRAQSPSPGCALDFVSPARGWCVRDRAAMGQDRVELFATTNGGASWQQINQANALPAGCDKDVGFTDGMLGWTVTACVAGAPPIYRTGDGGAHWTTTTVPPPGGDLSSGAQFLGIPVTASGHAAVALDFDRHGTVIYRSVDGGSTWHPVRPPGRASLWAVDVHTPDTWTLIHDDQLLRTDDGGRSWTHITMDRRFGAISSSFYDFAPVVDFPTRSAGWVREFDTSQLWHTTTAGRTWTQVGIPRT